MLKLVIDAEGPSATVDEFAADTEHDGIPRNRTGRQSKSSADGIGVANRGLAFTLEIMPVFGAQTRCGVTEAGGMNRFRA